MFYFMADFNNSHCYVDFYYPGNPDDISNMECYKNVVSDCNTSLAHINPKGTNLSALQVQEGCLSGLYAPVVVVGTTYSNMYCALCYRSVFLYKDCDSFNDHDAGIKASSTHFTYLLNLEGLRDPNLHFEQSFEQPCRSDPDQKVRNSA